MNSTKANQTIVIARRHIGKGNMSSSARICLEDAIRLYDVGDFTHAHQRALKSITYSVRCFHPEYKAAA